MYSLQFIIYTRPMLLFHDNYQKTFDNTMPHYDFKKVGLC